ncbi:DUF4124 domain-containing protein [Steroidobacter flavus]|uniref:DUF4124 domain-containing protein n=1 Tax=Steroidobacter flavus TaxID=1842136 RepID=A0ABV8STA7_9GAMM
MRTALYVLLALAAPAFAGQTVYKWVDEKGVTHFSDQPIAGAEKVELSSGPSRATTPQPSYAPSTAQPTQSGPAYSRFVVVSPQQDQSFVNTGGKVTVSLASSPAISTGHTVTLYLDGSPVSGFMPMTHEFSNMARGTHTVKAVVSNGSQTIQETPPVTFHVRQESIANPPVGPAMRNNKPKRTAGNKLTTKQQSYQALNGGKAAIDPSTNLPVKTKPAQKPGPKAGN